MKRLLVVLMLIAGRPSGRLAAQTDARLLEALRLAQSGQVDSARGIVRRLLATLSPVDSVYPQALLAAAKIAPDAPTVALYLNRIVSSTRGTLGRRRAAAPHATVFRPARPGPDRPGCRATESRLSRLAAARACQLLSGAGLLRPQERDPRLRVDRAGTRRRRRRRRIQNQVSYYASRCSPPSSTPPDTGAKTQTPPAVPGPPGSPASPAGSHA